MDITDDTNTQSKTILQNDDNSSLEGDKLKDTAYSLFYHTEKD